MLIGPVILRLSEYDSDCSFSRRIHQISDLMSQQGSRSKRVELTNGAWPLLLLTPSSSFMSPTPSASSPSPTSSVFLYEAFIHHLGSWLWSGVVSVVTVCLGPPGPHIGSGLESVLIAYSSVHLHLPVTKHCLISIQSCQNAFLFLFFCRTEKWHSAAIIERKRIWCSNTFMFSGRSCLSKMADFIAHVHLKSHRDSGFLSVYFPNSDNQVSAECLKWPMKKRPLSPSCRRLFTHTPPSHPLPVWPSSPSSRSPSAAPLSYADVLSLILSPEIN